MLDEIFNSEQYKNILTESTKADIERFFNEAVEVKATQIASEQIDLKEAELVEKYDRLFEEEKASLLDKVDSFLEEQMDKFASVVAEKLDDKIDVEQARATSAIFEKLITVAGVDKIALNEKAKRTENAEYAKLLEDFDSIKKELDDVKKQNLILKTQNIINEKTKSMNLVDAEKFKSAVYLLNVDEKFEESIDALYESFTNKSNFLSDESNKHIKNTSSNTLSETYEQYTNDESIRAKSLKF